MNKSAVKPAQMSVAPRNKNAKAKCLEKSVAKIHINPAIAPSATHSTAEYNTIMTAHITIYTASSVASNDKSIGSHTGAPKIIKTIAQIPSAFEGFTLSLTILVSGVSLSICETISFIKIQIHIKTSHINDTMIISFMWEVVINQINGMHQM